jgi:trk system potassium uptake protein TrkA
MRIVILGCRTGRRQCCRESGFGKQRHHGRRQRPGPPRLPAGSRSTCGRWSATRSIRRRCASAGIEDADLLIAVTQSDQTNLVACKLAHSVFNVPTRIARLRSRATSTDSELLLATENFAVSYALCPEQVITDYIARSSTSRSLAGPEFRRGRWSLVGVRAYAGGLLVGSRSRKCAASGRRHRGAHRRHLPPRRRDHADRRHGHRGRRRSLPAGRRRAHPAVMASCAARRAGDAVMIAGGGNIGLRVAERRSRHVRGQADRGGPAARRIRRHQLKSAWCCNGDATDEELLQQEAIDEMDLFLALTNDDEDNIMAASLAKNLGCKRRAGADQPPCLCRTGAGRADRHRHFTGAGVDRRPC